MAMRQRRWWWTAVLAVWLVAAGEAGGITLVRHGKPNATIVIPDGAGRKVRTAAGELQHYLAKMTGAKLPIVPESRPVIGPAVLVGRCKRAVELNVEIPDGLTRDRTDEGYVIVCRGETLLLAGNDRRFYRGTEYAVSEFLQRLGVRWFMPGEFGEIVPRVQTLRFDDVEFRDKPDFLMRNWWLHTTAELADKERRWRVRNKLNPEKIIAMPSDSTLRRYLPEKKYLQTRPELFARQFNQTVNPHMPNLSHADVPAMVAAKLAREFESKEAGSALVYQAGASVGIAPDDGLPMDHSPGTMKLHQGFTELVGRRGVPAERSISEEWFRFINRVAGEVTKGHPNRILVTNGYANRNLPPEGVTLHPNLAVMYAAIWADTLHALDDPKSWHGTLQSQCLKRWCKLNHRVFLYQYNYNMLISCLTPLPTLRKLARNIPLMKKWGVIGFFDETRLAYMEHGILTRYIRAKLYWDADADVEALSRDFYGRWYGRAAAPARGFWDTLEKCIEDTPLLGHEERIMPYVYTSKLLAELEKHVGQAEGLARAERMLLHVRVDRLILEHLKAYMAMRAAEFAGDYGAAAWFVDRMLEYRGELNKINPAFYTPEKHGYKSGVWYWTMAKRKAFYQKLHAMTAGPAGKLVVMAPKQARFRLDEADLGRFERWQAPAWDHSSWRTLDTTRPYYLQGYLSKTPPSKGADRRNPS